MKIIPIQNSDKLIIVDDEDFDRLKNYKWYINDNQSTIARNTYSCYRCIRKFIAREVMQIDRMFDHIDRNPLNNQKNNLRRSNQSQNSHNRKKKEGSTSNFYGVHLNKKTGKWIASIKINGNKKALGYFKNEVAAACVYDVEARKIYGKFANTNFVIP